MKTILEIGKNKNRSFAWLKKAAGFNRRSLPLEAGRTLLTGFTLVEVVISISILSIGLVLILQGLTHLVNIIQIAQNNTQATFLADELTTQFLLDYQTSQHFSSDKESSEMEVNDVTYNWNISIEPIEQEEQEERKAEINEIASTVSWVSGRRKGQLSVLTYLGVFPDEEE